MLIVILAILAQDKSPVELFKQRIGAAKSIPDKVAALRELGEARDPAAVSTLARYLAPQPSDCNCALPIAAADGLSRLRGSVAAARALVGAAEAVRKNPYLYTRYVEALAGVGHEAGLALFEETLKGPDAPTAVKAIASFPPSVAVEALLLEGRKSEKKGGEGVDKLREELIKGLQKVSGEKYPSFAEFELWWKKRGPSFRAEAEAREKAAPPPGPRGGPTMIVELPFRENGGMSTSNAGASAALYPACAIGNGGPAWTGRVPINAGPSALEWTKDTQALELGAGGLENLRNLKSFTLSGWILRTEARDDGQRVLTWLGLGKTGEGVDLALRSDGRLQLGVNQPAEASTLVSTPGAVPTLDAKAKDVGEATLNAWRFFAVTYDSTASADHVKFYAGGWNEDVKALGKSTASRGPAGAKIAPSLTIGNAPPRGKAFRGVLDELRIHGSATDGSGALPLDALIKLQNRQTTP